MPFYELARGLLDPGLFSDNGPKQEEFYGGVLGLPFIERLRHSPTYQEVFFGLPPRKLKVQSFALPMTGPAVTGYRELWIARDGLREVRRLRDADGLEVALVPRGFRGVSGGDLNAACEVRGNFRLNDRRSHG